MNPHMIIWPTRCCNQNSKQGMIFVPKDMVHYDQCECIDCGAMSNEVIAIWYGVYGFPSYRLKELKPPTFDQLVALTNARLNTPQRVQDRASRPVALLSTYFGDLT